MTTSYAVPMAAIGRPTAVISNTPSGSWPAATSRSDTTRLVEVPIAVGGRDNQGPSVVVDVGDLADGAVADLVGVVVSHTEHVIADLERPPLDHDGLAREVASFGDETASPAV